MMEKIGNDFNSQQGLNFGRGRQSLLRSFVPEGKTPDYYHKTQRGLEYVITPLSTDDESAECVFHDHSFGTSSWDSDGSIGVVFRNLSVNMVSARHPGSDDKGENKDLIFSINDPWIRRLNTLWDIHFEQRDPPTEDKVVQIIWGMKRNPSLSSLVKVYRLSREKK